MKIFVAGATGAVGKRLLPLLVECGFEVVGMTRSPEKELIVRNLGAEPAVADGLDRTAVMAAVMRAEPDVVIHEMTGLTGMTSLRNFDKAFALTNRLRTEGTDHLLEAAQAAGARASSGAWRLQLELRSNDGQQLRVLQAEECPLLRAAALVVAVQLDPRAPVARYRPRSSVNPRSRRCRRRRTRQCVGASDLPASVTPVAPAAVPVAASSLAQTVSSFTPAAPPVPPAPREWRPRTPRAPRSIPRSTTRCAATITVRGIHDREQQPAASPAVCRSPAARGRAPGRPAAGRRRARGGSWAAWRSAGCGSSSV